MAGSYTPATSRAAWESIQDTLTDRQLEVLRALDELGSGTMDEIAVHTNREMWRQSISARLHELHHDLGLVRVDGTRKGMSGRNQQVYRTIQTQGGLF